MLIDLKLILALAILTGGGGFSGSVLSAASFESNSPEEQSGTASYSYAMGRVFGQSFAIHGMPIVVPSYMKGFNEVTSGEPSRIPMKRSEEILESTESRIEGFRAAQSDRHRRSGQAYLKLFQEVPGVKTTSGGVAFLVTEVGKGVDVTHGDVLSLVMTCLLPDGLEIALPGLPGPMGFEVGAGIEGLSEVLKEMTIGSKFRAVISPDKAFGETGNQYVPPNATLDFTVEILGKFSDK